MNEWGGVYTVEEGGNVGEQPEVETIEEGELKDVRIGGTLNKKQKKQLKSISIVET